MTAPQGTFEYTGGIDGDKLPILGGWSVTLTHGLTPSTFEVRVPMVPGKEPDKNGDVILRYDDVVITLKNCTIDKCIQDEGGRLEWIVTLIDRRYLWRFGQISGAYNVRWRNGSDLRQETKKQPSQLAELCLQAMRETAYDLGAIKDFDDTDFPEINWNVVNPSEALQQLCERYGCRAIFDWKKDRVRIVRVGEGAELDTSIGYTQNSLTFDPPEMPGKLVLLCGPSSVQYDFPLEAVALDVDGKIKYPDQVSYAPKPKQPPPGQTAADMSSGTVMDRKWLPWAGIDGGFYNISVPYLRHLALESMLRWYRIVPPETMPGIDVIKGDDDTLDRITFPRLATDNENSWMWQIVLQPDQNDRLTSLADPQNTQFDEYNKEVSQTQLQAWVYGNYLDDARYINVLGPNGMDDLLKLNPATVFSPPQQGASVLQNQDTPTELQNKVKDTGFYTGGFSIDAQHGLVKFSDKVRQSLQVKDAKLSFLFADGSELPDENQSADFPATLFLRARFFVRDKTTRAFVRYQKTKVLTKDNDRVRYIVKDDLMLKATYRFEGAGICNFLGSYPPTLASTSKDYNKNAIDEACDAYLNQIAKQYVDRQPQTVVYPGFLPITLDGAIRQVTWMVDGSGFPSTRVSRDQEELHIVRDYGDRRLAERLKSQANQATLKQISDDDATQKARAIA